MTNFRERLHPRHSNAETQITAELHRRGYTQFETDLVLLWKGSHVYVYHMKDVTKKMIRNCDGYTLPDWTVTKKKLPIYLDSPLHLKLRCEIRDGDIDFNLLKRGWNPRRIAYNGRKLPESRLHEIVDGMVKTAYDVQ